MPGIAVAATQHNSHVRSVIEHVRQNVYSLYRARYHNQPQGAVEVTV